MRTYLDRIASKVRSEGITCQTTVALEPDAGEHIARLSHSGDIDLIALTTEAPTDWARLIYGSIADRVVRVTDIPLFIVRVSHATC
jgi:nucleotide-binding universal stress UspA family protein